MSDSQSRHGGLGPNVFEPPGEAAAAPPTLPALHVPLTKGGKGQQAHHLLDPRADGSNRHGDSNNYDGDLHAQGANESPSTPPTPSLQVRTDFQRAPLTSITNSEDAYNAQSEQSREEENKEEEDEFPLHRSASATSFPRRAPSVRAAALAAVHSSAGSLSPGSAFSSPQLAALTDITPLPSPIQGLSPWLGGSFESLSRTSSTASNRETPRFGSPPNADDSGTSRSSSFRRSSSRSRLDVPSERDRHSSPYRPKSRGQHSSTSPAPPSTSLSAPKPTHTRNRSLSEYVPPALHVQKPRNVPGTQVNPGLSHSRDSGIRPKLHREEYLAIQRGISLPDQHPPSPPRSSRRQGQGVRDSESDEFPQSSSPPKTPVQTYNVKSIRSHQPRRYRKIRQLGQGAFSQVVLAVREWVGEEDGLADLPSSNTKPQRLVAIKVVEHGPAGGADEERVEVSLKREVAILKSINHPSLVQLKAFGSDSKTALLVLDYCPGGDLFEVATDGPGPLRPDIVRRIFAELVDAVRYLHKNMIVHRDIKLENVLVTIAPGDMRRIRDWRTYPRAVVTLSDLGLSRRIPEPPESPLLRTRCGSEDYAAPEILMGQPYDGRSTDGWALAVLLYAIMESRLPFDPLPGTRGDPAKLRARTPHRIARCEWSWYRYADEDGEWDPEKGKELEGARQCVEGLLRRSSRRTTLDEIAQLEWIADAIDVPQGLKRGDRETP